MNHVILANLIPNTDSRFGTTGALRWNLTAIPGSGNENLTCLEEKHYDFKKYITFCIGQVGTELSRVLIY